MPRRALAQSSSGLVVHVLNRAARGAAILATADDYRTFQFLLSEAVERYPMRLLAYCLMPNHWHLVVWPPGGELPAFMHWLTLTHAKRWHRAHDSAGTGHLYQNRYRAIPVQNDHHLIALLRYVERNAARAGLVERAEAWPWSSLRQRLDLRLRPRLSAWPVVCPSDWTDLVNRPNTVAEIEEIRSAVKKGRPLGSSRAGVQPPPTDSA